MLCTGIPFSTHLLSITLTYLSVVSSNILLSIIGTCTQLQRGRTPDDWKIFDVTINCIQWLLILHFLWTTISLSNKISLFTWLCCQLTITLMMVLRIPIVLKEIFPSYSEIYDIHPNICPIYYQIFAFYLLWLGLQMHMKIKHASSTVEIEDIEPLRQGFRETWNYHYHINPGCGIIILLVIETIDSLAILTDEVYLAFNMESYGYGISMDILSPNTIGIFIRGARFLMCLWAICSLTKSKKKLHCSSFWIFVYVCLFIVSLFIFISVLKSTNENDDSIHIPYLFTSVIDLLFQLLIVFSIVSFTRNKH